jgi:glyoxylase-like metal-dependent hydrolase (beta-lactamase superfamily II)
MHRLNKEQLAPLGLTCVDTGYVRPELAACYLLNRDGEIAIIETGTTHTLPILHKALVSQGLDWSAVRYVIPTHVHLDHAGGVGALMAQCPQATLLVHPRGARHMIDPSKLIQGTQAVYGEEQTYALYGTLQGVPAERLVTPEDGAEVALGRSQLTFLHTEGHAKHHFCVFEGNTGLLFSGDMLGISYPDLDTPAGPFFFPTTTPVQFDPEAMHQSLDRLAALGAGPLALTHYGVVQASERIFQQLHRLTDRFVACVRDLDLGDPQSGSLLEAQIRESLQAEARALVPDLDLHKLDQLTEFDVVLNSQGLLFWANHTKTP